MLREGMVPYFGSLHCVYLCVSVPSFYWFLYFNCLHPVHHRHLIPFLIMIILRFLRPGFDLRPVPMGFMADKLALDFSPVSMILPTFHALSSTLNKVINFWWSFTSAPCVWRGWELLYLYLYPSIRLCCRTYRNS